MYVVGPLDTDMSGDTQLIKTEQFHQETLGTDGPEAADKGSEEHQNTGSDQPNASSASR